MQGVCPLSMENTLKANVIFRGLVNRMAKGLRDTSKEKDIDRPLSIVAGLTEQVCTSLLVCCPQGAFGQAEAQKGQDLVCGACNTA